MTLRCALASACVACDLLFKATLGNCIRTHLSILRRFRPTHSHSLSLSACGRRGALFNVSSSSSSSVK